MFGQPPDERRTAAIRSLKARARALFEAGADDVIVVSELACSEPGCPPIETVVALLRAGQPPRQVKLHQPAVEVTDEDLCGAIGRAHEHQHPRG
jgi:hypothetical protein